MLLYVSVHFVLLKNSKMRWTTKWAICFQNIFLLTKLIPIMNTIAHHYWQACFVCISIFFYTFSLSKAKLTKTLKQQMLMVPTASAQLRAAVKGFAFSSKWLLLVWLMDPEAVADAVSQILPCLVRGQDQTFWSVVENCCLLLASVLEWASACSPGYGILNRTLSSHIPNYSTGAWVDVTAH